MHKLKNLKDKWNKIEIGNYLLVALSLMTFGCASSEKKQMSAKETAARYWQNEAYPGKAYDVQVVEAESIEDGKFRVRGIVDGQNRVGVFNPKTESFSEGYYSLSKEKEKKIAELEQEVTYWKDKFNTLEKEHYKLSVQLGMIQNQNQNQNRSLKQSLTPASSNLKTQSSSNDAVVTKVSEEIQE